MTDEQFKALMDKLEELKRALPSPNYIGSVGSPYFPQYPKPYPWQPYDGLPPEWKTNIRD